MLQVIKFLDEKMDDGKMFFFSFEILFLILCKCFKSYEERDNLKHYNNEIVDIFVLCLYIYFNISYILWLLDMGKYKDVKVCT